MIALCQARQGMREMLLGIFSIFSSDLALTYSYTLASLCRDGAKYVAFHVEFQVCVEIIPLHPGCMDHGSPDMSIIVLSINQGGAVQCHKEHFC